MFTRSRSCSLLFLIEKLMGVGVYFLQCIEKPQYTMTQDLAVDGDDLTGADTRLLPEKGGAHVFGAKPLDITRAAAGMRNIVQQTQVGESQHGFADGDQRTAAGDRHQQRKDLQVVAFFPTRAAGQQQDVEIFRLHIFQAGLGDDFKTRGRGNARASHRKCLQRPVAVPAVETSQGSRNLVVGKALEKKGCACLLFHDIRFLIVKTDEYLGDLVSRIVEIDMQKRFRVNTVEL